VCLLVRGQIGRLGEALGAVRIGTDVGLLAGVRAQVRAQVEVEREAFLADFAFVGALACVH